MFVLCKHRLPVGLYRSRGLTWHGCNSAGQIQQKAYRNVGHQMSEPMVEWHLKAWLGRKWKFLYSAGVG